MDREAISDGHAGLSRRAFLRGALAAGAGLLRCPVPQSVRAAVPPVRRRLAFYHTHTEKNLELTYAIGRIYNPVAMNQLNAYLGDFRTGEIHPIDPQLMDILWALQKRIGGRGVFSVISGYRSPHTNAALKRRSRGVAGNSLHMQGKAIDVRFSEVASEALRDYAIDLQAGGVGFYPDSDFVHLDTGRVRTW